MTRLNEVRDDHTTYNNRLDTTLADVFNLLSLFFLTIGRTKEAPATYSQIASMRVSSTIFSTAMDVMRSTPAPRFILLALSCCSKALAVMGQFARKADFRFAF